MDFPKGGSTREYLISLFREAIELVMYTLQPKCPEAKAARHVAKAGQGGTQTQTPRRRWQIVTCFSLVLKLHLECQDERETSKYPCRGLKILIKNFPATFLHETYFIGKRGSADSLTSHPLGRLGRSGLA